MFTTEFDFRRTALCAGGALLFSALCVGGAVAPAQAAAPRTLPAWQADAADRLDASMARLPTNARSLAVHSAEIVADIDDDGKLHAPRIGRTSGSRITDGALLRNAAALRLAPPLSATPRKVVLRVMLNGSSFGPAPAETTTRLAVR